MAIKGNPIMSNIARLNQTGLNGLSQCGTDGLQTVSSLALQYLTCIKARLYCLGSPARAYLVRCGFSLITYKLCEEHVLVCRDLSK